MFTVHAEDAGRPLRNFWNNIHFHPTDAIEDDWGQRILDTVARDGAAETVRMYAMLEDIVTMDESGALQYDFTLNDRRLDYMLSRGFGIFLTYCFIPPCIALETDITSSVAKAKTRYKGKVIYPTIPRDYGLWEEICREYTRHIVDRYGEDTVSGWYLQCYNEPDVTSFFYQKGTDEDRMREYVNLYRAFAKGVSSVSTKVRICTQVSGNPGFLDYVLSHVKAEGLKVDFISIHTYGVWPGSLNNGSGAFDARNTLEKHMALQEVIDRWYPALPIVVDEWGAATCGFWNVEECPALFFRETSAYAAYMGKMVKAYIDAGARVERMMICLSGQHEMTQDFSGFRNLFTLHFIRKPIYNAYLLMHRLKNRLLPAESTCPGAEILATKDGSGNIAAVIAYASEHFDRVMPAVRDTVTVFCEPGRYRVTVRGIDAGHCDPCMLARRNGWTEPFDEKQLEILRGEGMLKIIEEYELECGTAAQIPVSFADNALWLVELERAD